MYYIYVATTFCGENSRVCVADRRKKKEGGGKGVASCRFGDALAIIVQLYEVIALVAGANDSGSRLRVFLCSYLRRRQLVCKDKRLVYLEGHRGPFVIYLPHRLL